MNDALRALDRALYRAEQVVAGLLFLVMAIVMFASVTHRVFSREEGRLSGLVLSLSERFGAKLDPAFAHGTLSNVLNALVTFAFVYLGFRTMKRATPLTRGRAVVFAAVTTLGLVLAVEGVLLAFPNGLVWGPVVSLCCMLWVGFLGASLATYDRAHLALEMGDKIWPSSVATHVKRLSALTTAGFCVFLLLLAIMSIRDHHQSWVINHFAGNLLPTPIPKWAVFLIFPYTFVVMGLRFIGAFVNPPTEPAAEVTIPAGLVGDSEKKR